MRYHPPLRYLARVFVDSAPPPATREMFERAQTAIQRDDLTATVAQEASSNTSRIAFAGTTGMQLVLAAGSFDLTAAPTSLDGANMGTLGDFATAASQILPALLREFDRTSYRMALVREGQLDFDLEAMARVANHVLRPPPPFDDHPPFEWDWRIVSRIERSFGSVTELVNAVVALKRQAGVLTVPGVSLLEFDRVRLDLDINTSQHDMRPRHTPETAAAFFEAATTWHEELWAQMETFVEPEARRA